MTDATRALGAALSSSPRIPLGPFGWASTEPLSPRAAFAAHFAEHAPDGFRPDEPTMARLADTWAVMQDAGAALGRARPDIERAVDLTAEGSRAVEEICQGIPAETWDAVVPLVDDWEVVAGLTAGSTFQDVLSLAERLAAVDPPCVAAPEPTPVAEALKAQPPLVVDAEARAYPPGAVAVRDARYREATPPRAAEHVHWRHEAEHDIAVNGVAWAEGHVEGLQVAASLASCSSELIERTVETGRPDPYAGYSAAWTRYENEADAALAASRQAFPTAGAAVDRPAMAMPAMSAPEAEPSLAKTLKRGA